MRALVRLYPRRWRDRYESEILDLLDQRPLSIAGGLDLVRGALDAHLHPQVPGRAPTPQPWTHRIPGIVALTAGLLWTSSLAYLALRADLASDWGSLVGIAFVLMLISLPGDYMAAGHGRRIAIGLGVIVACFVGIAAIPAWPIKLVLAAIGYLVVLGGMLGLAAVRAGIGSSGRWRLIGLAIALPVLIGIPAAVGVTETSPSIRLIYALIIPYGLAWLLIGLRMAIRGAPTIVDPPVHILEPEVQPA
jgi:hypothetical protein